MNKSLFFIFIIIFSLSLITCEKDDSNGNIIPDDVDTTFQTTLSTTLKSEILKFDIIEEINPTGVLIDSILPFTIKFKYSEFTWASVDVLLDTVVKHYYVRPVIKEIIVTPNNLDFELFISESNDSISVLPNGEDYDIVNIKVNFKWQYRAVNNFSFYDIENFETSFETYRINMEGLFNIGNIFNEAYPSNKSIVDIYTVPEVYFNYILDEKYTIPNIPLEFTPRLESFELMENGNSVEGEIKWNDSQKSFKYWTNAPLKEETEYQLLVKTKYDIRKTENLNKNESDFCYSDTIVFSTKAKIQDTILSSDNILYSYPVDRQFYYYPLEHDKGFLKLTFSQDDLTGTPIDPQEWEYRVRFTDFTDDDTLEFPMEFDYENLNFSYVFSSNLDNEHFYKVEFYKTSSKYKSEVEDIFYIAYFNTSKYNTFLEKINSLSVSSGWWRHLDGPVYELGTTIRGDELFDYCEIRWTNEYERLIKFEIDLAVNDWYNDLIYPIVYKGLTETDLQIQWRNTEKVKIPPSNAMNIRQYPYDVQVTDEMIEAHSTAGADLPSAAGFIDNTQYFMNKDYLDLKGQAENYPNQEHPWIKEILNSSFPVTISCNTYFRVKYVLPGGIETSSRIFNIFIE